MGAKPARCLFDALPFARAGRASLSVIFKRREGVTLLVDRLRMRSRCPEKQSRLPLIAPHRRK
jgi:hypothetical protein